MSNKPTSKISAILQKPTARVIDRRRRNVSSRNASERGAALVETALAFPLLAMLLMGIVSSSIAYEQSSSIKNASRETSRYGATLPVDGDLSAWLVNVSDIAVASATGDLNLANDGHSVCVAYVYPDGTSLDDSTLSLTIDSTTTAEGSFGCFTDGRPDSERRVQVVVERGAKIEAVFFSSDVTLRGKAASRFERGAG
jgi:hypothetical protein